MWFLWTRKKLYWRLSPKFDNEIAVVVDSSPQKEVLSTQRVPSPSPVVDDPVNTVYSRI